MNRKRLTQDAERVNPVQPVHIWRSPQSASVEMLIVTHLSVYSTIHEHATAALPNETGGFLIGRVAYDHRDGCWHLEIDEAMPVEPESQDPVHFTFTWRDVDRVRSYREGHSKALIGWYHTHPQIGIFLSETDMERTHRVLFSEPFQVALVYDPVGGRAGYFFWEGAQTIDASQATWREFDIAVAPDPDEGAQESVAAEPDAAEPRGPSPEVAVVGAAPSRVTSGDHQTAYAGGTAVAAHAIDPNITAPAPAERAPATPHVPRLRAIDPPEQTRPMAAPEVEDASRGITQRLTPVAAGDPMIRREPAQNAHGAPAAGNRTARALWAVLAGIFFIITGLAVGYFWFGPGRGLP